MIFGTSIPTTDSGILRSSSPSNGWGGSEFWILSPTSDPQKMTIVNIQLLGCLSTPNIFRNQNHPRCNLLSEDEIFAELVVPRALARSNLRLWSLTKVGFQCVHFGATSWAMPYPLYGHKSVGWHHPNTFQVDCVTSNIAESLLDAAIELLEEHEGWGKFGCHHLAARF